VRLTINLGAGLIFTGALVLTARHLVDTGWPLADANPMLAACAGLLFLLGYGLKAVGWQRLFAPGERPRPIELAVAGGAASVTGIALPGRFDDVVRIAVARKAGCRNCVKTLCLSLFLLGLVDAVALMPLSATGAGLADQPALRAGLAVVAAGGAGAALILLFLPRITRSRKLSRFRLARWLGEHVTDSRAALASGLLVSASWLVRVVGLMLLLGAVGIGFSLPLAILFLTAAAASAALPVAPAGAATQIGAGAAILVASGVSTSDAVSFAMSAQLLVILAAATVVGGFVLWQAACRVGTRFAAL
jgi:Lysylphosphatidylglycerol synthase TM region